ncbi:hypothetical protein KL930_002607 [Ogataea haglerorum]|uniref:Survival protein SurE-like phosphatase/nucleotidase domain-containing protein n=1 Tax=Ogataea haglerorum TaxID=1937702 RepID=A0AAN6I1G8_9ASCO|nr:hypothetical protein KL915_002205 [Ogataea haglerorum]KAG7697368.1 hypothetical protein KL951_002730 [Ogataea haglerorum]KAG7707614.1 hypothetical protein KL914_002435 [Ogataea haglerorum]KAG7709650.1 hypothetical protein KL950_001869 [Ogataea haglerorum]KAG7719728.1 hypothetical protein KL913_001697 [Ogataea haglerorum]
MISTHREVMQHMLPRTWWPIGFEQSEKNVFLRAATAHVPGSQGHHFPNECTGKKNNPGTKGSTTFMQFRVNSVQSLTLEAIHHRQGPRSAYKFSRSRNCPVSQMQFTSLLVLATSMVAASAKNILLTNDDGWAATNIRAFYRDLKAAGHNVVMVAPARQYSGNGGRFILPPNSTLTSAALFNYPPAGSPAWGHEEDDPNVWYFDGSPAACVALGLDYVIPKFFDNMTIDIVLGGPNEGTNLGERDYVISGTIGSAYYATERGYPAIAFSGANSNNSFFKDNLDDDPEHAPNIYSKYALEVVETLAKSQDDSGRLLPEAYGLNVNFPPAGSDIDASCRELTFRHTRFTGSKSLAYKVAYNSTAENMEQTTLTTLAVQNCAAGDCELPDEYTVINNGNCEGTISVFTLDFDASEPITEQTVSLFESVLGK